MPSPKRTMVAEPQRRTIASPAVLPPRDPPPRPAPHVRSPERSRLGATIARIVEIERHKSQLEEAHSRAMADRAQARSRRETAERELVEAEKFENAAIIAQYFSDRPDSSASAAAALRDKIAAADTEFARASRVADACRAELAAIERPLALAESDRRNALRDALTVDPACARLHAAHAEACALAETLREIMQFVPGLPESGPPIGGWPVNGAAIQHWREALAALERDPDAVLPSDDPGDRDHAAA